MANARASDPPCSCKHRCHSHVPRWQMHVPCRQGNKLVACRIPAEQLPLVSEQWAYPIRPSHSGHDTLLCQRSQSCFKAVHHSGICTDLKGTKRKDRGSSPQDHGSAKRRCDGKRKNHKNSLLAGADGVHLPQALSHLNTYRCHMTEWGVSCFMLDSHK
jgi:hypothetical protein